MIYDTEPIYEIGNPQAITHVYTGAAFDVVGTPLQWDTLRWMLEGYPPDTWEVMW